MNLPQDFVQRTSALLGQEYNSFASALDAEVPVSIRLNPYKTTEKLPFSTVAWADGAYYLPSRPSFTLDPVFHAGVYYVQEASSMFLSQVVKQYIQETSCMLDLCAAPGGKSTHLLSELPEGSLLISNEYIRSRAYILSENIQKWGKSNAMVCNNTPADLGEFSSLFDAILIDAPCSGEGMFRKDEGAVAEWSMQNVATCAARQQQILEDVWPSLKQDGILIYSTCTYNREENEERVRWICEELGAELLDVELQEEWGVTKTDFGYRFYPHKTRGEGFFLSVMRKTSTEYASRIKSDKQKLRLNPEILQLKKYCKNPDRFEIAEIKGKYYLLPKQWEDVLLFLIKKLNVIHVGIPLGEMKGKNFIPETGLALSMQLDLDACECAELDLNTALSFLRTENITLPDSPIGLVLVTFMNHPLGWVKNIGNRCNSFYPNEWRIRMNIPSELSLFYSLL